MGVEAKGARHSETIIDRFPELKKIDENHWPKHIFIIPDGNGRWAKKVIQAQAVPYFGHRKGAEVILNVLRDLRELSEIRFVTLWGFSADNWSRSPDEVNALMSLFKHLVKTNLEELNTNNVRFIHLGRKDRIPPDLREVLKFTEKETKENKGQTLSLAIDFGGEDQTLRMLNKVNKVFPGRDDLSEEEAESLRDGDGKVPSADLIIRTSGEQRLSDPGWISGRGSEIFLTSKLLPEIDTGDIVEAIVDFAGRDRRWGGRPVAASEQPTA